MEWTKERRYRTLEEASQEEVLELEQRVNNSVWRQTFHIQPNTGLLNDPNGFSYFNGEYHLFYQWFPLGPVHGLKYWYHVKSKDLVNWEDAGIGIKPGDYFDSHGAYSGSAIEHEGKLYLLYTGNTRDNDWGRNPYQCLAVMNHDGEITKLPPVLSEVPEGYTDHFRDPKIWKKDDQFFMVIGAQRTNETGCIVLYQSKDLLSWSFKGEMKTELPQFGYMWECPDYFELGDQGILVFSPQGIAPNGDLYQNIYQSGYLIGNQLDVENGLFSHGEFQELDRGFDFYAPQTMEDHKGRRILVGWVGLPEIDYPTDSHGWAHCLSLPRELTEKNGKLLQNPVKELQGLRKNEKGTEDILHDEGKSYVGFTGTTYELITEFQNQDAKTFGIEFRTGKNEKTIITYDTIEKKLVLDRTHSGTSFATSYGTVRKCTIDSKKVKLQMFVDVSSVEIFVNDGEEVFTSRIFPSRESEGIRFFATGGKVTFQATKWELQTNQ